MSLINQLIKNKIKKIKVDVDEIIPGIQLFLVRYKNSILAFGFKVDDSDITEDDVRWFRRYESYIENIITKGWRGFKVYTPETYFIFYISDRSIIYSRRHQNNLNIPDNSLEKFWKDLKNMFEFLKTPLEKLEDKYVDLEYRLEYETDKYSKLKKQYDFKVENESELKNEVSSLEQESVKLRWEISRLEYFEEIIKKDLFNRITLAQKEFLLNLKLNSYFLNLNELYPNLIYEYEIIKYVPYDTATDFLPMSFTKLAVIDEAGNVIIDDYKNNNISRLEVLREELK